MDFLSASLLNNLSVMVVLAAVSLSIITDKMVWHTRLKQAEARADRWEAIALDALTSGAQAGVKAAEVTAAVVSSLPDPSAEGRD